MSVRAATCFAAANVRRIASLISAWPKAAAQAASNLTLGWLRIYSVGTVLTTDRISSGGLHSGSVFLGGCLTTMRSGSLTTGWSAWARVAGTCFAGPVTPRSMRG